MSESPKAGAGAPQRRKSITLERVYHTNVQDVWDLVVTALPCVWAGGMLVSARTRRR